MKKEGIICIFKQENCQNQFFKVKLKIIQDKILFKKKAFIQIYKETI